MLLKHEIRMADYENKYIFTKKDDNIYSFYMEGSELKEVDVSESQNHSLLHSIYIAKVQNIVKNLNAAFVEYERGKIAYLEIPKDKSVVVLNRQNVKKLAQGDEIVVQIVKEPQKTKEAVATTNLTLSGTYCVVSSERRTINYSSKLSKRFCNSLKEYFKAWEETNSFKYGAIIRTNTEVLSKEEFSRITDELMRLQKQMDELLDKAQSRMPFTKLYDESDFVENRCRDFSIKNTDLIVTDDVEIYETLCKFPNLPSYFYNDKMISLTNLLNLNKVLTEALNKKVWLKCGGYLVIEVTEALTVIDVNSGKCTTKKNKEDLISLVNMQAAKETMRQIRLRNLSGIILIDFMKYTNKENEKELFLYMEELAAKEKIQTNVIDITPLGLMELTRKKVSKPLYEKISRIDVKREK